MVQKLRWVGFQLAFKLVILTFFVILAFQLHVLRASPSRHAHIAEQELYQIRTEVLQVVTLGYRSFAASVFWVQAIFAYSDGIFQGQGLSRVVAATELVVSLDPEWKYPYEFAGLVFDGSEKTDPNDGLRILDRGIANHPDNWRFRLFKAMILRKMDADPELIASVLEPLMQETIAAPEYVRGLAVTLLAKDGRPRESMILLLKTIEQVRDPVLNRQFQGKIGDVLRISGVDLGEDLDNFLQAVGILLYANEDDRNRVQNLLVDLSDSVSSPSVVEHARKLAREFGEYKHRPPN